MDSGRFSYNGELAPFRTGYGVRSRGHNVLLLDGKDQVNTWSCGLTGINMH